MNIALFADGLWGLNILKYIYRSKSLKLKFVCVRQKETLPALKVYARKNNIKVFKVKNINSKKFILEIKKFKINLVVSMSFNQIFNENFLENYKVINCHAGMLPFYRGRNPINWAIINGEKFYGITVHFVDKNIDTGDIILQKKYRIFKNDNYKTILSKSVSRCSNLLLKAVFLLSKKNNKLKIIKQKSISKKGSYFFKRKSGDEIIDLSLNADQLINFVRGLVYPGPYAVLKNKNKYHKVISAKKINYNKRKKHLYNNVIEINNKFAVVNSADGFVKLNFLKK